MFAGYKILKGSWAASLQTVAHRIIIEFIMLYVTVQ